MVEGKGFEGGRRLRVSEEEDSWLVLSTVVFGSFWDAHASKVGIENFSIYTSYCVLSKPIN